ANLATKAQQIAIAEKVLADQGPGAWPVCSIQAGLTKGGAAAQVDTSASNATSDQAASRSETRAQAPQAATQQAAPKQDAAPKAAPKPAAAPKQDTTPAPVQKKSAPAKTTPAPKAPVNTAKGGSYTVKPRAWTGTPCTTPTRASSAATRT
ncbi:transglycosylase family protein, partial [Kitasatospora cinereorecta]